MQALFDDRRDAGRQLGETLKDAFPATSDLIVLGLPRGGVPVAYEVAQALHAPLDILLVRKLGLPGHKEYAMGAIAEGGVVVVDKQVLDAHGVQAEAVEAIQAAEQAEMARRAQMWRAGSPPAVLEGKTVILGDDGLATGSTMRAAVAAARRQHPAQLVVAVPVSSEEAWESLRRLADDIICLHTPSLFRAVGLWYAAFPQTRDEEVSEILARSSALP
jgi:predicted phosphoribosyltransferase